MRFAFTRLRATGRDCAGMLSEITADADAVLAPAKRWGAFSGLFGVASNELLLLCAGEVQRVGDELLALDSVSGAETLDLEPTARPVSDAPLTEAGLYVLRLFDVANRDVDEIVELSRQAWETFEATGDYRAEPKGLFRPADRSVERGRMLLVTWYDGFDSWLASRNPHPDARRNFLRRHELTQGTVAYATRLVR